VTLCNDERGSQAKLAGRGAGFNVARNSQKFSGGQRRSCSLESWVRKNFWRGGLTLKILRDTNAFKGQNDSSAEQLGNHSACLAVSAGFRLIRLRGKAIL
jgi:hypothetical protein